MEIIIENVGQTYGNKEFINKSDDNSYEASEYLNEESVQSITETSEFEKNKEYNLKDNIKQLII